MAVAAALLMADGQQVCQGLSGVLVAAVTSVDDGHIAGCLRYQLGGPFSRVADHRDIGVAADGADGIRNAFALGY
ncbi:hypothetical protein SDC9_165188 [bioreactor metagenome]|uniref:Uncharacterized protein n=1 Tax=bioreactor metagenome TaxID=1076179 RepID=A0A645G0X6_9ZZZZ